MATAQGSLKSKATLSEPVHRRASILSQSHRRFFVLTDSVFSGLSMSPLTGPWRLKGQMSIARSRTAWAKALSCSHREQRATCSSRGGDGARRVGSGAAESNQGVARERQSQDGHGGSSVVSSEAHHSPPAARLVTGTSAESEAENRSFMFSPAEAQHPLAPVEAAPTDACLASPTTRAVSLAHLNEVWTVLQAEGTHTWVRPSLAPFSQRPLTSLSRAPAPQTAEWGEFLPLPPTSRSPRRRWPRRAAKRERSCSATARRARRSTSASRRPSC